jgi:hypothetical protein
MRTPNVLLSKKVGFMLKETMLLCVLGGCLLVTSCTGFGGGKTGKGNSNVYLAPREYVQWMQDPENGIKKEKTIDDVIFSALYKPSEYIICMEEKKDQLTDSLVKKRQEEFSDMEYFDLTIALESGQGELLKHGLTSIAQYDERVQYFAFEMQKDIKLVEDGDTIPCGLYHFERAYDVAPYSKFMLGFVKNKKTGSKERTLVFYDRVFNKGLIKFTYTDEDFNNIPKLKTDDEL